MNSQKLEIMEDMLTERLKFDWDKRTTTHLKEMLEEVKKEIEYNKEMLNNEANGMNWQIKLKEAINQQGGQT